VTPDAPDKQPFLLRAARFGLAWRIAVAAATLSIVVVLAVGILSYRVTDSLVSTNQRDSLRADVVLAAQQIESEINALVRDARALAANGLIRNAIADSQGRQAYLQPFFKDYRPAGKALFALTLTDFRGITIASTQRGHQVASYAKATWLGDTINRAHTHVSLGDVDAHVVLTIAWPVLYPATNQPEGALVLELRPRQLMTQVAGALLYGADYSIARDGQRVMATLSRELTNAIYHEQPLVFDAPLDKLGLSLRVGQPVEQVGASLRSLALFYVWIGLAVLAVVIIGALLMARRITRPLARLSGVAQQVTESGDIDVRLPVLGHDEVGRLAQAIDSMLARLRESRDGLERQVAERTSELRDSEARMRAVIDNVIDAIITIDESGIVHSWNHAAERIFGYQPAEVIGRNISMLMPEPYHSEHDRYLQRYIASGTAHIIGIGREVIGRRRDGSEFPMDLAVSEVWLGGVRFFTGVVRDITERRKVDRLKNEFVSTVSHELRTPLTSIRGALGLLSGGAAGAFPEKAAEMINIAYRNTDRLSRLINDILDIEKIESGKMQLNIKSHRLPPMLVQAIEANAGYAAQYGVEFVLRDDAPDVSINVDSDRLQQVLSNLLSNAAKFSPAGSRIDLWASRTGDTLRIGVTDRGSGIPDEFRDKIFQKFSQADASDTRQKGGTGLGLSISQAIVERMRGEIGFESGMGAGTTFWVDLPCRPVAG
jgi:PAS domain S-box-containing protein